MFNPAAFPVLRLFIVCLVLLYSPFCQADLVKTVERIKPAIVGIGSFQKLHSPPVNFLGTGFVVEDGLHAITNAHVISDLSSNTSKGSLIIMTGKGEKPELRNATIIALDKEHDLALLRFEGTALPAMKLGDAGTIKEGKLLAFTGFPIGMVLGFYPVTHRATILQSRLSSCLHKMPGSSMRQKFDNCKNRLTKYFSSMVRLIRATAEAHCMTRIPERFTGW